MKAEELYVRYGKSAATAICELGYPSCVQLVAWYKEWKAGKGDLAAPQCRVEALRCRALSLPWQMQCLHVPRD